MAACCTSCKPRWAGSLRQLAASASQQNECAPLAPVLWVASLPGLHASPSHCCLQKAAAVRQARELEVQRDVAIADALRWRQEVQQQKLAQLPPTGTSVGAPGQPADVTTQLTVLQQQLEHLAADGSLEDLQLQQERTRMSICLRTIKVGGWVGGWQAGRQAGSLAGSSVRTLIAVGAYLWGQLL